MQRRGRIEAMPQAKKKAKKKLMTLESFLMHTAIAGFGAMTLLAFAAFQNETFQTLPGSAMQDVSVAEITIEHDQNVKMELTLSRKASSGLLLLEGDQNAPIHVSLPELWQIKEVQGVPYDDVTSSSPSLGYTRYFLPAGAGLLMQGSDMPDRIVFASPSDATALLNINTVDLLTGTVNKSVVLLQHDSWIELWEDEE